MKSDYTEDPLFVLLKEISTGLREPNEAFRWYRPRGRPTELEGLTGTDYWYIGGRVLFRNRKLGETITQAKKNVEQETGRPDWHVKKSYEMVLKAIKRKTHGNSDFSTEELFLFLGSDEFAHFLARDLISQNRSA